MCHSKVAKASQCNLKTIKPHLVSLRPVSISSKTGQHYCRGESIRCLFRCTSSTLASQKVRHYPRFIVIFCTPRLISYSRVRETKGYGQLERMFINCRPCHEERPVFPMLSTYPHCVNKP